MPPKRKASQSQLRKRVRTEESTRRQAGLNIGAPTEDDSPSAQQPTSSSSSSTRVVPPLYVPALTTLSARVFVANLRKLSEDKARWRKVQRWIDAVPDAIVPNLFAMLRASWPRLLNDALVSNHFLRGHAIALTSDLTGVKLTTISAVKHSGSSLRELELSGFEKFPDASFAAILPSLPALRKLNLRASAKVGARTVSAVAASCPELLILNLSYTAVPPIALADVLRNCKKLEVLKLAGITPGWTDATLSKLLVALQDQEGSNFTLPHLRTLKLRQSAITDTTLHPLLRACPSLQRLDLSFTGIKHAPAFFDLVPNMSAPARSPPPLEKLALTSTMIAPATLTTGFERLPHLRTLHLGALGGGSGTAARLGNVSALTLSDALLDALTDALVVHCPVLEALVLSGNAKLSVSRPSLNESALGRLVRRVGRRCKKLDLAGVKRLRSADLAGLVSENLDDGQPALEVFTLDNTDIDDDAALFLTACTSLRTLGLSGTRVTSESVFPIINANPRLEQVDLTGCRGIKVADRRRFFEVWEEWKNS